MAITKSEIKKLPKIDLHRHLDGDLSLDLIYNLTKKSCIKFSGKTKKDLKNYFIDLKNKGIANLFQEGFGMVTSLMQTSGNLRTVAYEEVRNLYKDNIIYAEIQFAPQYHTGESAYYGHAKTNKRINYEKIIKSVWLGLKKGEQDFGIKTNLIIDIGREAKQEVGIEVAKAAINCTRYGVVALGLATNEADFPPELHKQAFQLTFGTELKRSVHAGEFGNQLYKNIVTSINELKADRLGHARIIAQHNDLINLVKENKIGIESCPESNMFVGLIKSRNEINIKKLFREGILVSINSDDPGMFGYTLTDSIYRLSKESKTDFNEIKKLEINAALTSFLRHNEKKALIEKINKAYK